MFLIYSTLDLLYRNIVKYNELKWYNIKEKKELKSQICMAYNAILSDNIFPIVEGTMHFMHNMGETPYKHEEIKEYPSMLAFHLDNAEVVYYCNGPFFAVNNNESYLSYDVYRHRPVNKDLSKDWEQVNLKIRMAIINMVNGYASFHIRGE